MELLTDTPYEEIRCSICGSMFSLVDRNDTTRLAAPLKTIDRFDLVSRLGIGGFGTVWKAHDRELDRIVAVKIPRRGQLAPTEIEQFFREARAAAQLRHPHIVPVHEVGRDGDTLFIVSDFVRGVTLSDWLTANRLDPWEVAELCVPIASALHHAHQQGVVHRDLKPSNIMIDEERQPHLTDFGLAKREVGEITMTMDGQVLGTPAYMSPEQARGQGHWTDRRTDIYSFGVILFELLTGELPFRGNAQMQIHQRLTEDAPDPQKLNRHIPRDLATICVKCLEREPGRRYSTAAAVAEEFQRFLRGEPIEARPISAPARLARWAKRKPAIATIAALVIVLAIAGPVTALVIEGQRQRLSELVLEKDNVIKRYTADKKTDANQIVHLRQSLDVWEGRANPWQLWPPSPTLPPRKTLMEQLIDQRKRLTPTWQKSEERAFGHLALAIMSDEADRTDSAVAQYQVARTLLTELAAEDPTATQYQLALADCCRQLGRLLVKADREAAKKDVEQGRALNSQLAALMDDPRHQVDWLEAELEAAILGGFAEAGASKNLERARQITDQFKRRVPKDAVGLYQLACYLGGREPILITRKRTGGDD